jgi:glycosyltransferase involved in cell wall biosynthesis
MRVAVDARTIYSRHRRGTGKNLIDLYRHLARLYADWQFVMFHQSADAENPFDGTANVTARYIDIKGDRFDFWQQIRLPLAARAARADVLHCPANTAPQWPLVPMVVSIHDLIAIETAPDASGARVWRRRLAGAATRARGVLTPSHYSKQRIIRELRVPEPKITVNQWAPDESCRKVTDTAVLDRTRHKYGLAAGQEYVFAFGASDPRKNTERIILAWAGLEPNVRAGFPLLMVGLPSDAVTRYRDLARSSAPEGSWSINGFADEGDLPALLSAAAVLCYPSLNEGFGLPVLDAFVCETAVVTSDTTSLPEVAGDAAVLVDPRDVCAITAAIQSVVTRPGVRADLQRRGAERVRQFSWQRVARTAGDVFAACAA